MVHIILIHSLARFMCDRCDDLWTYVDCRLPKEGDRVMVYGDYGCDKAVMVEHFDYYLYKRQGITHWMPLPLKPKSLNDSF